MHFEFSLEDNLMNRLTPFVKELESIGIDVVEDLYHGEEDKEPKMFYKFSVGEHNLAFHTSKESTSMWMWGQFYKWGFTTEVLGAELNFYADGSRSLDFDYDLAPSDYGAVTLEEITWGGE